MLRRARRYYRSGIGCLTRWRTDPAPPAWRAIQVRRPFPARAAAANNCAPARHACPLILRGPSLVATPQAKGLARRRTHGTYQTPARAGSLAVIDAAALHVWSAAAISPSMPDALLVTTQDLLATRVRVAIAAPVRVAVAAHPDIDI